MFKRFSIMMLGVGAALAVSAAPITPNQALARLSGSASVKSLKKVAINPVLKYSFAAQDGQAVAYAFEPANGQGFMILAADDAAYPVLGYSENGKFDVDNMPVQLKSWIEGYGEEIEYARSMGISPAVGTEMLSPKSAREAIAPLVKSKWDQGEPYNNDCPKINGVACYTGCVATSMAQVMNYFKYPEVGTGVKYNTVGGTTYSMNFADKAFDWNNMLDNYVKGTYNETQSAAVAYLMKACGFSVNMGYGTSASGAVSAYIASALRDNFKYDSGITFEGRVSYSASDWDEKIYNNIKNGSPVIYNGNDLTVGHSFICDGYDGNGYYHINWGWSGMSDGYFLLNALNPEALGTGGGEGGGFNFRQGGVFNIRKPGTGGGGTSGVEPSITAYGLIGVSGVTQDAIGRSVVNVSLVEGYGKLCGWMNETSENMRLYVGGVFVDTATGKTVYEQSGKLGSSSVISPSPGSYYQGSLKIAVTVPSDLPDGDYKMIVSTKNASQSTASWTPVLVPYSYPDYVLVSKKGTTVTATSVENPRLQISDFEAVGNVYYGRRLNAKFKVKNASEYELTEAITVELKQNGVAKFRTANVLVTVAPNSEIEQEWSMLLYAEAGQGAVTTETEFDVNMVNELSGKSYGDFGKVTMRPNPGNPSVSLRSISIDGATTEQVQIGNSKLTAYVVDMADFTVNLTFRVTKGYFDYKVYADLLAQAPGATSASQTVLVKDDIFSQQVELNATEEATLTFNVKYPEADPETIYYVKCKYYGPKSESTIGQIRIKALTGSGVDEIESEAEGGVRYFNLQGIEIENPEKGQLVIKKSGSKTEKVIF